MNRMRSQVLLGIALFLFLSVSTAFGQIVGIDWVPVGSGARAMGMGGAFTSIADDATAAFWNPAGLTQLERPEVSLVGQQKSTDAWVNTGTETLTGTATATSVNFASIVYPLGGKTSGARKTLSLNYGKFLDFNSKVSGPNDSKKVEGAINDLSLAFATELSPNVSIGVSLISLFGKVSFDDFHGGNMTAQREDITGYGYSAGVLWKGSKASAGFLFRSKMHLEDDQKVYVNGVYDPAQSANSTFNYPYSLALGCSYRPVENFTVAFDYQFVKLSDFSVLKNPVDIAQFRLGVEYLIVTKGDSIIPLRLGAYTNPNGFKGPNGEAVGGTGITAGSGIVFKDFQIDAAYDHVKRDVTLEDVNVTYQEKAIDRIMVSAIYRF